MWGYPTAQADGIETPLVARRLLTEHRVAPRTARRIALLAGLPLCASALASCGRDDCRVVVQVTYSASLVEGDVRYLVHGETMQLPLAPAATSAPACVASLDGTTRDDAIPQLRLKLECHEAIGGDVTLDVILPVDLRTIPADGSPHAVALPRQEVKRFVADADAGTGACFDGWTDASASVVARDAQGSVAPFPAMVSADWARTFELELRLATPATSEGPLCAGPEDLVLRATMRDAKARYTTADVSGCRE